MALRRAVILEPNNQEFVRARIGLVSQGENTMSILIRNEGCLGG